VGETVISRLLLGFRPGSIGVSIVLLFAGAGVLLWRILSPTIPLAILAGVT
jgi:hypothetical protein